MILDQQFPLDERVEKEALTLIENGFDVSLLCFNFGGKKRDEQYKKIQISRVYMPRFVFKKLSALILTWPFYRWFWKYHIKKFVQREKPDALHIHDLPLCGIGIKLKNVFNLPVVADMHENYPEMVTEMAYANTIPGKVLINKKKWFEKEKEWLNQVDRIIVVVREMQDRLEATLSAKKSYSIVPNTLNITTFSASQKESSEKMSGLNGRFVITYFGGLDSVRGIETLIEAANLLRNKIKTLKVLIVGSGSLLDTYRKKSNEQGLMDIIQFEGWQDPAYLGTYMKYTTCCIIPHLKSPQTDNSSPNKLFIYMMFKKAIIASNCMSVEKIITDANCGLIFESGNAKALSEKILQLYHDPALLDALGENGYNALLEKYEWEKTSLPLVELYKNLKEEIFK